MTDNNKDNNCFHALVSGKVQGVGYRYYAFQSAKKHGLKGWVRNLDDGRVEVYAEGDELDLTEFLTDLYKGPVLSRVDDIDITWKSVEPSHTSFSISG